jgi:amino acid adenylation domain-containing protein
MDPERLSPEDRRAALAALLRQRAAKPKSYPLSFAQQRVWYAQQLDPANPFFNLAVALRLAGALDPQALAQALAEIVRRHEALRTVFVEADGLPLQQVAPPPPLSLPWIDLAGLAPAPRDREIRRLAAAGARRPFDLSSGLLLRAALVRAGSGEHFLLCALHHIAGDGWSLGVLAGELARLYTARLAGRPAPLPELPLQYRDFAVWERERSAVLDSQLDYWRERLSGLPQLELPTDLPRPRERTWKGASRRLALPAVLSERLRALAREEGATLPMVALAAFQLLLCRYTGQEDLGVALSVANRERAELAGLIGQFSNTVVSRADLTGRPSFRALLSRVRGAALGDYAHQGLSFDRLVEALQPQRDPSRHPLVQVMFGFRNAPVPRDGMPGLTLSFLEFETGLSRFDLELVLWEEGLEVQGAILYNTDLFRATTVARLAGHLQRLLAGAVQAQDFPVAELPLLSAAERHQLQVEWNDTATPGDGRSILQRIAGAAERDTGDPDAMAVACGGEVLSYGELARRSSRLARYLRARGAGPGCRVGLLLDRSLLWPVALLACLRSGAAFVPLDPRYPEERLRYMATDARLAFLLTAAGQGRLDLPVETIDVAAVAGEGGEPGGDDGPHVQEPGKPGEPGLEDLAYLVYTSGSTGLPKGVAVAHRNLSDYATLAGSLGIGPGDSYLHSASLGFAAAVRQLLAPLSRGATVVLATADELADPLALCRLLRRSGVTVLELVPSYWQSLGAVLDRLDPAAREDLLDNELRLLLAASEPLPSAVPRRWAELRPAARFVHFLGHSETSGIDAVYPVPAPAPGAPAAPSPPIVPLGRPAPDRRIYLLDAALHPVPLGIAGEIYIGGAAVASGYWERPELTAAAFVPDPLGGEPGARLYRTGDQGRLSPDGTLIFAGRRDRQTKVRGQRVEIGEIEAALAALPGVGRAVVEPRPVQGGEVELVAYLTPGATSPPGTAELRRRLGERLPPSMIPAAFVLLETLPLTPTGKLDRAALPAPQAAPGEDQVAPRSGLEARMAEIWAETLHLPRVGALDDFFALGGHSLLAVLLLARVREAFGVEVGLRAFLSQPTVAGLSSEVESQLIAAADPEELATVMEEVCQLS